ncbi:MAG: molybdopterin-guanine dinucleotide biosynthesis protein B [Desulfobulbaceae bacterium]
MIPIVSFIGWQDSGKTTVAHQVVAILKEKGYRVAVIKSTHHTSINFDAEGTDTDTYRNACADSVTLFAPDQMVTISHPPEMKLADIVHRFFHDVDIVICEGFKNERHIKKIEVNRGSAELLRDQVNNVIALVSGENIPGEQPVFHPDNPGEIAAFIEQQYLAEADRPRLEAALYVNGKKVPMKDFVQEAIAGTVLGFLGSLKKTESPRSVELFIRRNS